MPLPRRAGTCGALTPRHPEKRAALIRDPYGFSVAPGSRVCAACAASPGMTVLGDSAATAVLIRRHPGKRSTPASSSRKARSAYLVDWITHAHSAATGGRPSDEVFFSWISRSPRAEPFSLSCGLTPKQRRPGNLLTTPGPSAVRCLWGHNSARQLCPRCTALSSPVGAYGADAGRELPAV